MAGFYRIWLSPRSKGMSSRPDYSVDFYAANMDTARRKAKESPAWTGEIMALGDAARDARRKPKFRPTYGKGHVYSTPELKRTSTHKQAVRMENALARKYPGLFGKPIPRQARSEFQAVMRAWERAHFYGWADNYRRALERSKAAPLRDPSARRATNTKGRRAGRIGHAAQAELKRIDRAFELAVARHPYTSNVFDDPQIKRLMERRDYLLGITPEAVHRAGGPKPPRPRIGTRTRATKRRTS